MRETTQGKTLHIFNPEHDLALAAGNSNYTPPAEAQHVKDLNSLLPACFADNGDFILISSTLSHEDIINLPYFNLVEEKKISLIKKEEVCAIIDRISKVAPWGWDKAVCSTLRNCGVPPTLLKTDAELDKIRDLSHRRTVISFRKSMAEFFGEEVINPPQELYNILQVEEYLEKTSPAYFKAPWSSSGHGIVVSDHISRKGLLEWAHGVIRKQGSVIAEPSWNRTFDFATEWEIIDHQPVFKGYSVFKTSSRGKYHGNISAPQPQLLEMIMKNAPAFSSKIVEAQKNALRFHIAPYYEGPLGIDMLADTDGRINPCVEINLRLTMGHLYSSLPQPGQ